jgi:hypothetical protein
MLDSADAAGDAAEQQAILEGRQITAGATAIAQRDKLIELANALAPDSPLRAQIAGYIAQLDVVIARQREAIPNLQGGGFLLPGQTGQATNLGAFAGRPMATGGAVTAGTYYPGGELGPELFRGNDGSVGFIPGQDGTVIPTSQISGGGTTVNQTFNIVAADTGKGIDEGIARARMAALTGLAA